MIPESLMSKYTELGCKFFFNDIKPHEGAKDCDYYWAKIQEYIADINIYDLYTPPYDYFPPIS